MPNDPTSTAADPYAPFAKLLRRVEPLNRLLLRGAHRNLRTLLRAHGCRRVLDLCCGTGSLTNRLHRDGYEAVGLDASPTMLALAREAGGATFLQGDAAQFDLPQPVDAVVISQALHEMDPAVRPRVWAAMQRATHPGGLLLPLDFAPPPRGWLAQAIGRHIAREEASLAEVHPPHAANYLEFMAQGGLPGWAAAQGIAVEAERRFWRGNLSLLVVRAP